MRDTLSCLFCDAQTKPGSDDSANNYLFRCPNCGTFLMSRTVYKKMSEGEFATYKPMMLEFIKKAAAGKVAHFGFKVSTIEGESRLRSKYRLS
jgi:protein-arginine kinase activator protein McsA